MGLYCVSVLPAARRQGVGAAVTLAARMAALERALLLQRCRQIGVAVVDWQVDVPFQQVAEAALSRPPLWQNDARSAL